MLCLRESNSSCYDPTRMNFREYQRLKAEAQAEYRRKIDAIETVWKLSGGVATTPPGESRQNGVGIPRGSLQHAVRAASELLVGDFTHRDVQNQIATTDPAFAAQIKDKLASISGCLNRMAEERLLILVERGAGKRPSRYRRPG